MSGLSNRVRIHWSRLRNLIWLIFVVGVSVVLLVFIFGTSAGGPHQYGSPIFWKGLHLSEWSERKAEREAQRVVQIEPGKPGYDKRTFICSECNHSEIVYAAIADPSGSVSS